MEVSNEDSEVDEPEEGGINFEGQHKLPIVNENKFASNQGFGKDSMDKEQTSEENNSK